MGRPPKDSIPEKKMLQPNPYNRVKGEKWTQSEMESLASLCISHGRNGILSKETNKATTAKKDMQWMTVQSMFNSIHPPRDKTALVARYKYILMFLRKDNARERRNYIATGDGPRAANNEKMPFEVTGPMLELSNLLGVSISGMDGFGSDATLQLTSNTSSFSKASNDETQLLGGVCDNSYTFEQTCHDHLQNLINDGCIDNDKYAESCNKAGEAQVNESQHQVEYPVAETETMRQNKKEIRGTSFPGQSQFFPTSSQRRSKKRVASSAATDSYKMRKEYITERAQRESERHAAEMRFEKAVMEAKLEEIVQNGLDRQVQRERRAELHEITIRHNEGIFKSQMQLLNAACNVLTCSSPDVALRTIISSAMGNTGCNLMLESNGNEKDNASIQ